MLPKVGFGCWQTPLLLTLSAYLANWSEMILYPVRGHVQLPLLDSGLHVYKITVLACMYPSNQAEVPPTFLQAFVKLYHNEEELGFIAHLLPTDHMAAQP